MHLTGSYVASYVNYTKYTWLVDKPKWKLLAYVGSVNIEGSSPPFIFASMYNPSKCLSNPLPEIAYMNKTKMQH